MGNSSQKLPGIDSRAFFPLVAGVALLSLGLKACLIVRDVLPFNSDEAIVALMARHILQGERPIFFYGQAYMGSLDAILLAAGFKLFGQHVDVVRWIQAFLYAGTVVTTICIGKILFQSRRIALIAGLLMALPTVNTTLYTSVSLGGYGEALLIGNLLIILALRIESHPKLGLLGLWGFLAGLGFWAFGLTAVYILPSGMFILLALWRSKTACSLAPRLLALVGAALIGLSPILIWAGQNGFADIIREAFGSAIAGASPGSYGLDVLYHVYSFLLFGPTVIFGMRPPWGVQWLAVPLLPFAMAFWLLVLMQTGMHYLRQDDLSPGEWILLSICLIVVLGFILSPFGADPSGRYFIPLAIPLSIFAARVLKDIIFRQYGRVWMAFLLAGILIYNLLGIYSTARNNPPGLTTQFDAVARIDHSYDQALIDFLEQEDEQRGYSNYWVSYPLAFQSEEEIIFIPRLPYHEDLRYTERDDRYEPYQALVEDSQKAAYITTHHPVLDAQLRQGFEAAGLSWQERQIGDYHIFFELSSAITPEDIGIYENEEQP